MSQRLEWIRPLANAFGRSSGHLKEQGVTIVYSSHYIEEVEHTADRILVLHQGHLLRDTTPLAMRSEEVEKHFTLPLRYQALVAEMEGIGQVTVKPDALQVVTRDANRLWRRLQGRRMFDPRNRSNQSKFIGFYF